MSIATERFDKSKPGLYFFSVNFTPIVRVHTALFIPEKGESFEISIMVNQPSYYLQYHIFFYVNNKELFPFDLLLKKFGADIKDKRFADYNLKFENIRSEIADAYFQNLSNADSTIVLGNTIWNGITATDGSIQMPTNGNGITLDALNAVINHLIIFSKEKKSFDNNDFQGFISAASAANIKRYSWNFSLARVNYLVDDVALALLNSGLESLKITSLKSITPKQAEYLGKLKGKLFLDALDTIDVESAKWLTSQNLKYLSLRGLDTISDELKDLFKNSTTFVSLKNEVEEKEDLSLMYSKEEIDNSVASDRKQFSSLKKLLTSSEKDVIDSGLLMLSSFSDPYLFDKLIEDIEVISTDTIAEIKSNSLFKGTKKEQPLFNYVMTGILFYAGTDSLKVEKLKNSIKGLSIDISDLSYLHCFKNLETLMLSDSLSSIVDLNNLDESLPLKKIHLVDCPAVTDIDKLFIFPIEDFDFGVSNNIKSFKGLTGKTDVTHKKRINIFKFPNLETFDGFDFYHQLECLGFDETPNIKDVSGLRNLKFLKNIKSSDDYDSRINFSHSQSDAVMFCKQNICIKLSIGKWTNPEGIGSDLINDIDISCEGMEDLEWLKGFPNLLELSICCKQLKDISGLRYANKLSSLVFDSAAIESLKGVEVLSGLKIIIVKYCNEITQIDDIANLNELEEFKLSSCKKLTSFEGFARNKSLAARTTRQSLDYLPSLKKIGDLSAFEKLEEISFDSAFNDEVIADLITADSLQRIEINNTEVKISNSLICDFWVIITNSEVINLKHSGVKYLKLESCNIKDVSMLQQMDVLSFLIINDCDYIDSLDGLQNLPNLKQIKLEKLSELKSVQALAEFKTLNKIKLIYLPQVTNLSCLVSLPEIIEMEITDCKALEVKPRPLGAINQEQVMKYQLKLDTHYKLDGKSFAKKVEKIKDDPAKKETKKTVAKLKKMLKERDTAIIDSAIAILEGLQDESVINELLEGITYSDGVIIPNRMFTGSGPAQVYLDYAILGILHCADISPQWKSFNDEVLSFKCSLSGLTYLNQFRNLEKLNLNDITDSNFDLKLNKLKNIKIEFSSQDLIFSFKNLASCTLLEEIDLYGNFSKTIAIDNGLTDLANLVHLKKLSIYNFKGSSLNSLLPLQHCKNLEILSLKSEYSGTSMPLSSLDGLQHCTQLQELLIDKAKITDTTALVGLENLKSIEVNSDVIERFHLPKNAKKMTKINFESCSKLIEFSDAEFAESLSWLDLSGTAIKSFPYFSGVKSIPLLRLNNCSSLLDFKGMRDLDSIYMSYRKLEFNGCHNLQNIDDLLDLAKGCLKLDIKKIPKPIKNNTIKTIELLKVEDLDGIEQFTELEEIIMSSYNDVAPVSSLVALAKLKNLKRISISGSETLTTLQGLENFTHLEKLDITRTGILTDVSALANVQIDTLYISGCFLKKADFPKHLQDSIDWQTIPR
jgi:hypothetical protein